MTDIVEQLLLPERDELGHYLGLMNHAADEIKQLRAALETCRKGFEGISNAGGLSAIQLAAVKECVAKINQALEQEQ